MGSKPPSRRVSFHTTLAAEPSVSLRSSTGTVNRKSKQNRSDEFPALYANPGIPSMRGTSHGSSLGYVRLKPLTPLKSGSDLENTQSAVPSKNYREEGPSPTPGRMFQSQHSRRGSASTETHANTLTSQLSSPHGTSISQASLPHLIIGNRVRPNGPEDIASSPLAIPHPYDVILPGEEVRRAPVKSRTVSSFAHSSVGPVRSGSQSSHGRVMSVGARRFTQTTHNSSDPSASGGAISSAAVHGRRFSSIAREPSAAAMPRCPSNTADGGDGEEGTCTARKFAKADTQMFLVSLKCLIGKDGGGETVGNLLAFIFQGGLNKVHHEFISLVKQALREAPGLHSAYVIVHFHEVIDLLQKFGGLLLSEPQVKTLFEQVIGDFQLFSSAAAPPLAKFTIRTIFDILMDTVTASPVYKSALLKLISTVCKLILASESLRDGVWTAFSQSISQAQPTAGGSSISAFAEFFHLLFSAIEQLTGGPVRPLVKHFISWLAIVDDLLTKLATEIRDYLEQPYPATVPPNDYTMHPLGYVYSPTESVVRLEVVSRKCIGLFTQDLSHTEALDRFRKALSNVIIGISGNSTFARFSRDLVRLWTGIWGDSSTGMPGSGLAGVLECFKNLAVEFVHIPIEGHKIHDGDFEWAFDDMKLSVVDALPAGLGFSTHSKLNPSDCTLQSSTLAEIKGLKLAAKHIKYTCIQSSDRDSQITGSLCLQLTVDLATSFIPKDDRLLQMLVALPYYGGSEVSMHGSNWDFLSSEGHKTFLKPQVQSQLTQKIREVLVTRVDRLFETWLPRKPVTKLAPKKQLDTLRKAQSSGLVHHQLPRIPDGVGNARDRFKASIRNLTGIKTDSVLNQLQNPFSGPPSPVASPDPDESTDMRRKRRQSMADYLTDISKADSTLPENIQRPPVAESQGRKMEVHNLPNVFDDDEDDLPVKYDTMARSLSCSAVKDTTSVDRIIRPVVSTKADFNSVFSHRGGLSNFPTGEMSYEAYRLAEASIDEEQKIPSIGLGYQDVPSMAKSLSEVATRDTTTEEAIANPPTVDVSTSDSLSGTNENMTMDKVTRHLSGLADSSKNDFGEHQPPQRYVRAGAESAAAQVSVNVAMANLLTEAAMEDNTLPENQATGRLAGPVSALGVPTQPGLTSLPSQDRVSMGQVLSKDASVDTTLHENIACPPGVRPLYRSPMPDNFSGLKSVRSMSTTLNDAIEKDYTTPESQSEMNRCHVQSAHQVTGLSEKEMKQRRQSFKLTDQAMQDTTLLEAIRAPPVSSLVGMSSGLGEETELDLLTRKRDKR